MADAEDIAPNDILVIRIGAMGDIIHALPAAASLKLSFPESRLFWLAAPKWRPLFEGNPHIHEVIPHRRSSIAQIVATRKRLRTLQPGLAIDFQGLIQSAIAGRTSRPATFVGLDRSMARESAASYLYTKTVLAPGPHRVERCLQLVKAAGANVLTEEAWLPAGHPEGELPAAPFVLANPFAGWAGKQWPIEHYDALAEQFQSENLSLVVNVPPHRAAELKAFRHLKVHSSGIPGLISATRCAAAVVGVDSGPLHMAAALKKPGVAIYGPTDPAQTGPYQSPITVLRCEDASTTYKRHTEIHPAMRSITPSQVAEALLASLARVHTS